jgi:hypothetical protein
LAAETEVVLAERIGIVEPARIEPLLVTPDSGAKPGTLETPTSHAARTAFASRLYLRSFSQASTLTLLGRIELSHMGSDSASIIKVSRLLPSRATVTIMVRVAQS